jgi:hypothetical protein
VHRLPGYVLFNAVVHLQTPLELLPAGIACGRPPVRQPPTARSGTLVIFEFKHFKPGKRMISTRCWSVLDLSQLRVPGSLALEMHGAMRRGARRPPDAAQLPQADRHALPRHDAAVDEAAVPARDRAPRATLSQIWLNLGAKSRERFWRLDRCVLRPTDARLHRLRARAPRPLYSRPPLCLPPAPMVKLLKKIDLFKEFQVDDESRTNFGGLLTCCVPMFVFAYLAVALMMFMQVPPTYNSDSATYADRGAHDRAHAHARAVLIGPRTHRRAVQHHAALPLDHVLLFGRIPEHRSGAEVLAQRTGDGVPLMCVRRAALVCGADAGGGAQGRTTTTSRCRCATRPIRVRERARAPAAR